MVEIFEVYCKRRLYVLNIHLLNHRGEDVSRFEVLKLLRSFELDRYKAHVKCAYAASSKRHTSRVEVAMRMKKKPEASGGCAVVSADQDR